VSCVDSHGLPPELAVIAAHRAAVFVGEEHELAKVGIAPFPSDYGPYRPAQLRGGECETD